MRSLRQRPSEISTQILLTRSQHPGPFLVVEGRDDRLFCERYTDGTTCHFLTAGSKDNVVEVISTLDEAKFAGVLGIVDPDFDLLDGTAPTSPNLVAGDSHDLEITLLSSPALDRVLGRFASEKKLASLGMDVKDRVLSAAAHVGYLRWLSARKDLGLKFQGLKLASCVDRKSLEVDSLEVCRKVKHLSRRPDLDEFELDRSARELRDDGHDLRHVCCGDDAMQILSIGLRSFFGTNAAGDVRVERLREFLQFAFEGADFKRSALSAAIRDWECRNPGFRVLKHSERDN